jgi:hypothetical protein
VLADAIRRAGVDLAAEPMISLVDSVRAITLFLSLGR